MAEDADRTKRRRAFLTELGELTKKYGVAIGGCGCCGSPWLDDDADVSDERAGYSEGGGELQWITPGDIYLWEAYLNQLCSRSPREEDRS